MPKAIVKTRKIGGSIVVRIPKDLVEQEDIREGEIVELEVRKARKDWFGAFPKLKPFSREEELDTHD
ncbi:MAG: AbrB/MazE/SpoVT family DNA-binding domain-containing protein [Thaumarchaeota archaeon]|nr:AbrB/MazE/SpoVT family DNA-binding domain-containing protein [Nitrososphaerota archaeon]